MNTAKTTSGIILAAALVLAPAATLAAQDAHFDIAPYFQDGKLLTGGRDHGGNVVVPPIFVYGYEFGEDPFDPFNPTDPGVNQAAGTGNLPVGAALRYNILSGLLYWDGNGNAQLAPVTGGQWLGFSMGTTTRTLTGTSGPQAGSLIQSVGTGGAVHKHFVTSLYADAIAGNIPGDPTYLAPPDGIYAFSIELSLTEGAEVYRTEPLWIVFNNGLGEEQHEAAMNALVPEPAGLGLFALVGLSLARRRRRTR